MIRIIDDKPHPTVVKQVVCRNCGVTMEYAPVDVQTRIEKDYAGGSDSIRYVPCPRCNHQQTVGY